MWRKPFPNSYPSEVTIFTKSITHAEDEIHPIFRAESLLTTLKKSAEGKAVKHGSCCQWYQPQNLAELSWQPRTRPWGYNTAHTKASFSGLYQRCPGVSGNNSPLPPSNSNLPHRILICSTSSEADRHNDSAIHRPPPRRLALLHDPARCQRRTLPIIS